MSTTLFTGLGKRKAAVAKVYLKEGSGNFTVNNKTFETFFSALHEDKELVKKPLILVEQNNNYDIDVKVHGGGLNAQANATRLAIAKALCTIQTDYRPVLKENKLLTRDARIKERRKYGLKKARKASQYSKR
jgi:small subunit ribosomal protein S9